MAYYPTFIKPSRFEDGTPSLNQSRIFLNGLLGIETSIVLDLNVLSRMNKVIEGEIQFEDSGLSDLVTLFNKNPVFITPGFGLGEADNHYILDLVNSYELFIEQYCPEYKNTPNCLNDSLNRKRSRKYIELEEGDKYMVSISYMSMLAVQIIAKENEELSPEEKFSKYIEYMIDEVDMLAAIEAEVAKIWFYDRSKVEDSGFKKSCAIIRDNFNKGGKGYGRLEYILNSARDLVYYWATARKDGEYIEDGGAQDTWLVTGDEALIELTKYIHYIPRDGYRSKFVAFPPIPEKETSSYWRYCDELFINTVNDRQETREETEEKTGEETTLSEQDWGKIFSSISDLEKKVLKYWPEKKKSNISAHAT